MSNQLEQGDEMSDSGRVIGDGRHATPKCWSPRHHRAECVCTLDVCWYCGSSKTDDVVSIPCVAANGGEHRWVASNSVATEQIGTRTHPVPKPTYTNSVGEQIPCDVPVEPPKTMEQKCWYCGRRMMNDYRDHLPCPSRIFSGGSHWWGSSDVATTSPHDPDYKSAEERGCEAVACLLRLVGVDPSSPEVRDTPKRVVRAWLEMTAGYKMDPAQILGTVFEESYDEIVILRQIPFSSVCEHHMLPFTGTVDVGYVPGKVVGLSKLARLVDCFALRLQMQERMTRQIAEALEEHLGAKGVAVVSRGVHSCMCNRGVKKSGAEMVCSTMLGLFRDNAPARAEFLSLCKG